MSADLDAAKIRRLLLKFSNEPSTLAVKAWLARQTLFHTLRITRAEGAHSGLIAWLLDPGREHGLGHLGLRKLFEVIALVLSDSNFARKDSLLPPWVRDAAILGAIEFRDVEVVTEQVVTTASGSKGRLDVFVQGTLATRGARGEPKPFRLIIENKIRASEGREQTSLYETWANENPLRDGQRLLDIFVYLTPLSTPQLTALSEPECSSKSFIQLNYQYLLEYLIEPFKRQVTDEESALLLLHYVRNLSHPPISDDEDEKGPMVMAIGTEEKELVRRFWNENKQLLQLVAEILADSEGVDETRPRRRACHARGRRRWVKQRLQPLRRRLERHPRRRR